MQSPTWTAKRSLHGLLRALAEVVIVGVPFFFYFLTRGAVSDRAGEAFERGAMIVDLERNLGLFLELQLQAMVLPRQWLIDLFNAIYFWAHFPLIAAMAIPLYVWRRHVYRLLRNTLIVSGALGLVIYVLFPVAPPRMMPNLGFVDTMAQFSEVSYQNESLSLFANPIAAVPSLHFGWALVIGLTFVLMFRHPLLRLFGGALPLAQGMAIIVTGNHFFFDALIGAIVSLAGFGIAWAINRGVSLRQIVSRFRTTSMPPASSARRPCKSEDRL